MCDEVALEAQDKARALWAGLVIDVLIRAEFVSGGQFRVNREQALDALRVLILLDRVERPPASETVESALTFMEHTGGIRPDEDGTRRMMVEALFEAEAELEWPRI